MNIAKSLFMRGHKNGSVRHVQEGLRDALTGLMLHSTFHIELQKRMTENQQSVNPMACMLLDIDYFHAINRRFGYPFGDAVLKQIAKKLDSMASEGALISRYAGEQFAVAWYARSLQEATAFGEEVRKSIANHRFSHGGKSTYLTVSVGMALQHEKMKSASELLSCCQLVLRTAKREGRNRVCYWEQESYIPMQPKTPDDLIQELQKKFTELEREMKAFGTSEVRSMLETLDIRDGLPEEHAENVAFIAASIADELGLSDRQIDTIISAALLHDIGKLGIDQEILGKNGTLSPEEFEEIKKHPLIGAEFLQNAEFFEKELPLIKHHHERYDGKGYPDGLKGDEIPLGARIIGLAETIDGLLSGSTYRPPLSIQDTIMELRRCAGTQFDPKLVQIAVNLLENGRIG